MSSVLSGCDTKRGEREYTTHKTVASGKVERGMGKKCNGSEGKMVGGDTAQKDAVNRKKAPDRTGTPWAKVPAMRRHRNVLGLAVIRLEGKKSSHLPFTKDIPKI